MKASATNLFFCVFALSALATISPPAAARDRPGTPNAEKARACGDWLTERPAVCVEFNNTASEPVWFETELTIDGEPAAVPELGRRIFCLNMTPGLSKEEQAKYVRSQITGMYEQPPYSRVAPSHRCEAASSLITSKAKFAIAKLKTSEFDEATQMSVRPQGIRIDELEPLSNYCFRFRTRRVSDEVVSAQWSNWACAQTRAIPAKPTAPTGVRATFLAADWDGSASSKPLPHRAEVFWDGGERAGYYMVQGRRFERNEKIIVPISGFVADGNQSLEVCAHNISGKACTRTVVTQFSTSLKPPTSGAAGAIHAIEAAAQGNLRPATAPRVQAPAPQPATPSPKQPLAVPTRTSEVLTPVRGSRAASVFTGVARPVGASTPSVPGMCKIGFVWREASPGDRACVTPDSRSRVAVENRTALTRVQPGGGAYGPNTCRAGFVWREAFAGDLVCVSPEVRMLVKQENQLASTRVQ
jgi:hypothetical protein